MKRILKFSIIILFISGILFNGKTSTCQEEPYKFSRAKVLSVDTSGPSIKILHLKGPEKKYFKIMVSKTTVIKKDSTNLKLSELKSGDRVSLTYAKDTEGNRIATAITVLPQD